SERRALVDPVDDRGPGLLGDIAAGGGAVALPRPLRRGVELLRQRRRGELQLGHGSVAHVPGSLRTVGREGYRYCPMPSSASPGSRGEKRLSSRFTEKRGPISSWPARVRV